MPIATLQFTLPAEQSEFDAALTGQAARSVLWEIDRHCRILVKHGEPTKEEAALAERIREMIREAPENLLD